MNLHTSYLGLPLRTPLIVSASPLSESLANIKRMEDAGASAIVLHSLFEEQLRRERDASEHYLGQGAHSNPEALTYFPTPVPFESAPEEQYLNHIARAKECVRIPIIASLNGSTFGGCATHARLMEQAGADALEMNIYSVPTDPDIPPQDIETDYLMMVACVKAQVRIPVAVKVSPYFTNFAHFARRLDRQRIEGLVLFNRFYQPDIDLHSFEVVPNLRLSTSSALRLPLRWIAILHGRLGANLAGTGGIHSGADVLKMLLAGADATMLCSALMARGIEYLAEVERDLCQRMEECEYESVDQLKGSMSQRNCPDPSAFERAQYVKAISFLPSLAANR